MTSRPSLARSTSFIVLLIVSVASAALGIWIVFGKLTAMTATLTSSAQSATAAVDVYGGQSWIVFGAALTAAGLIGLFSALAVASIRAILPAAPAAVAADATVDDDSVDALPSAVADEPVAVREQEPAAAS